LQFVGDSHADALEAQIEREKASTWHVSLIINLALSLINRLLQNVFKGAGGV
jgi:hypothetical protein